jgi:hypothetical protein
VTSQSREINRNAVGSYDGHLGPMAPEEQENN